LEITLAPLGRLGEDFDGPEAVVYLFLLKYHIYLPCKSKFGNETNCFEEVFKLGEGAIYPRNISNRHKYPIQAMQDKNPHHTPNY
jgi:hypothetical protein